MIGVGVFTTSGFALSDLGSRSWVLGAWLLGGCIALCGAWSYGALALRFPASGGEYEYLRRTLHPTAGTAAGIVSMLAGFGVPLAAVAHLLQVYGARFFGLPEPSHPWVGTLAILLAAWLHGRRVQLGSRLQELVVAVKLVLVAVFLIASLRLFAVDSANDAPAVESPLRGLLATMPWIYLAYSGWNATAYVAGEVVDAPRNVPRAMLLGCLVVTAIYLALNAVFLWSVDCSELVGRPEVAAIAARALLGRPGELLVVAIVVLALMTSILGMTMAGPRVYARMADDGDLPAVLRTAHGSPPRAAILFQSILALAFLWSAGLQALMTYIGWTLSLCAAAAVCGLVRVRLREGPLAVPCRGWPWVPGAFVLVVLWFAIGTVLATPRDSLLGLATVVGAAGAAHFLRRYA
ncbi:MAG: amino acid permease [Planctomycetes bacterium]|nr:amino acid permease [Planctomycetota bacterium]